MANSHELVGVTTVTDLTGAAGSALAGENFDIVAHLESTISSGSYSLQLEAKVILADDTVVWASVGAAVTVDSADAVTSIQITSLAKDRTFTDFRVGITDASASHSSTDGIRLIKSFQIQ
ncbi:hypothetical protein COB55_04030 [Candidatus Wolfebacteria bacterium]|nr:MAG: hypothetical protein COB55_04030 [Candidatus Wolfebacteria bacterium]